MDYRDHKLPQAAIKFANIVFVLGILFCISTMIYAVYRIFNPIYVNNIGDKGIIIFYIFTMMIASIVGFSLIFGLKKLNNNIKVNLSIIFFSLGLSVYGIETFLAFQNKGKTKIDAFSDLRKSGVNAIPNIFPSEFIDSNGFITNKIRIYPLGNISNSITILTNESGFYPVIKTDEYGFNNSKGLYIKNEVDILLIGDSYTEGFSVNPNETISAVLRKLNYKAISVGKSGNGPLLELAALKEYGEPLEPKVVLWLYYTNDLKDLKIELRSPLLKKYLNENDYSQRLIFRQKEIDIILKKYSEVEWIKQKEKEKLANNFITRIIKLYNLRKMISLKPSSKAKGSPTPIFKDILSKSKKLASNWNGKMYFIYLPDWYRYSSNTEHPNRNFVLKTVKELNIPIIDMHTEVFESHPDPLSLFPFRKRNHYNSEGYKLIGEAIKKRLVTDGYISIN
jgi:lysophospholipase L1-like esterase